MTATSRRPVPAATTRAGGAPTAHDAVLAAIFTGACVLTWWPLILALGGPRPLQPVSLIAPVCGMLGGSGVLVLLVLMSRAPLLERGVGADAAESGQFFRWRFLTPDHWQTAHPFSLSAPPTDRRLRLTVKALGESSANLQHIPVGTWVMAEGPYGAMTAGRRTRAHVLLIAGGVGITPMRALFETIPLSAGQDLVIVYRARRPEDVLFRAELDRIATERAATVHYLVGANRSCLSPSALVCLVPRLAQRDVYLCGPPPMADTVRASLRAAGLPAEHLHEERFAW